REHADVEEEQRDRHGHGEDHEPGGAHGPPDFEQQVAGAHRLSFPSVVRVRKASSRPIAVTSMSCAWGKAVSRARSVSSELPLEIDPGSPGSSTSRTPGSSRRWPSGAPGPTALIVRPEVSAVTSATEPSATIRPWRSRTTRSA